MKEKLRGFNWSLEHWLLKIAFCSLMIGFFMGTVDILTHGQMATIGLFIWLWSISQALGVDSLLVAVWDRIATTKWTGDNWYKLLGLCPLGLLLIYVAGTVNDIVTYQQAYRLTDSIQAMQALHIDVATFTNARAYLVVFVFVCIIFLRPKKATPDSHIAIQTQRKSYKSYAQKATITEEKALPVAIPEKSEAIEKATELSKKELCIAKWEESDKGRGVKKAIALDLGIGYSTVKKYLDES